MCIYPKEREIKCRDGVTRTLVTRCGNCVECQRAYSNEWALRLYHEKMYHTYTWFLTLTYDDDHLPSDGQLRKKDLQKFILALKKKVDFRYFACGEYGGKSGRPHYHMIIFIDDYDPLMMYNPFSILLHSDYLHYSSSSTVMDLWPFGFHTIETKVDFATLRYVAKYMQKESGKELPNGFQKPFLLMSHKPYIGMREDELCAWYMRRNNDDKFYVDGFPYPIPNFYTQVIERNGIMLDKVYSDKRLSRSKDSCIESQRRADSVINELTRPRVRV